MGELTPSQLRQAAQHMEQADQAASWAEGCLTRNGFGARVEWSYGRAVGGYQVLADEVSRIVEIGMQALLQQALTNLQERAAGALQALKDQDHA